MPQPASNEDVMAAILSALKAQQAEMELRRQKDDQARQKLTESLATLEKWRQEAGKGAAAVTGQKLDDGTLEVSAGGKSFRITPDGKFL